MAELATEGLVCGAGPTGLVLAFALARAGVRVRVIDAAETPGTTSRALVVHARTLELYRQLGLAEGLVAEGLPFTRANLWVRGRRVAQVELGDLGAGLTPFPYMLVVPQDRHERFLIECLARVGAAVERPTELVDFEETPERVRSRLRGPNGAESACEAAYLAGCDGARSRSREVLGAGFEGHTYSHLFFVADVEARGAVMNDELHVALDDSDLLGVFPLRGRQTGRLIGTVRLLDEHGPPPTWNDVGRLPIERLGIDVERVNWFSTYRVHHRVAGLFRRGRAFLLGDAAHIHSPVGGQGMNTGIGDALNLAWKLADVLRGRAGPALLDTYEPERMAFARRLVATTDRGFVLATSPGDLARFVRTEVVPRVLPPLVRLPAVRRFVFRTLSQTRIHYRTSRLSAGQAGRVAGGDRLPWVPLEAGRDNFAGLDGLRWQVHVYGAPGAELTATCRRLDLALAAMRWQPAMRRAGLAQGALDLVRPDGHVALAEPRGDAQALERAVAAIRGPRRPI